MDAELHPIVEIFGNGVATTRSYDPRNGELLWMGAGANYGVQSVGYDYDAVGNVVARNDGTQGVNERFGYDALNRLVDSALDQSWGNAATSMVSANVPAGTTIYEGVAAAQGGLVGGGSQVFIPVVNPAWIIP